jgi:hypothetical protein
VPTAVNMGHTHCWKPRSGKRSRHQDMPLLAPGPTSWMNSGRPLGWARKKYSTVLHRRNAGSRDIMGPFTDDRMRFWCNTYGVPLGTMRRQDAGAWQLLENVFGAAAAAHNIIRVRDAPMTSAPTARRPWPCRCTWQAWGRPSARAAWGTASSSSVAVYGVLQCVNHPFPQHSYCLHHVHAGYPAQKQPHKSLHTGHRKQL